MCGSLKSVYTACYTQTIDHCCAGIEKLRMLCIQPYVNGRLSIKRVRPRSRRKKIPPGISTEYSLEA
ncbi:hypothetical protein KJZ71_05620 [Patescibacteria group bacterium]|nr:hypothetical protein [Patescibacteria group bacterium]